MLIVKSLGSPSAGETSAFASHVTVGSVLGHNINTHATIWEKRL